MPAARPEIRALTGIRAVAAVWVLFFHLQWHHLHEAFPALAPLRPAFDAGYMGVDLFFILSGFILAYTYADWFAKGVGARRWRDFEIARLARIYPVHLATFALLAAFVVPGKFGFFDSPFAGERFSLGAAAANLALVQAWQVGHGLTWNGPAWSISAEWFAYLWFPFTCAATTRLRRPALAIVVAAAALFAVRPVLVATGLANPRDLSHALDADGLGGLVRIALEFGAGCLLCRAFESGALAPRVADPLAASSAAGVVALAVLGLADPWAVPLLGLLLLALASSDGPFARLVGSRFVVFWGRVSYSLYMIHWIAMALVERYVAKPLAAADGSATQRVVCVASALVCAGAAVLLWRFVEEPARRRIRDWAATPRTPPAGV